MNSDMTSLFAEHKLRVTKPRKMIFESLKAASRPLSHVELAALNPGVDKVSVYRTVDVFLRLGVVTSTPHGWKQRYELAEPFRPHHHHLLCTACGDVEEIRSEKLERIIHTFASERQFKVTGHTFEVTGLCGECRSI